MRGLYVGYVCTCTWARRTAWLGNLRPLGVSQDGRTDRHNTWVLSIWADQHGQRARGFYLIRIEINNCPCTDPCLNCPGPFARTAPVSPGDDNYIHKKRSLGHKRAVTTETLWGSIATSPVSLIRR